MSINTNSVVIIVLSAILMACCGNVSVSNQKIMTDRSLPSQIDCIVDGAKKYCAPISKPGFIQVLQSENDSLIWEKEIYKQIMDSTLEHDVQIVYIQSISLQNKYLLITNEIGSSFCLNLSDCQITKLKNGSKSCQKY